MMCVSHGTFLLRIKLRMMLTVGQSSNRELVDIGLEILLGESLHCAGWLCYRGAVLQIIMQHCNHINQLIRQSIDTA